ncbi:helix-turn-helix transcriptional regulator [Solicola gregarius]|uniref:helix-turn-helix transcriptional regulator n=1 Tax=Solicola gregarius TaxID=2908642 RepID=UPI0023060D97|nr:AraC family transcriptional regulator [Solicola gregarius]
MASREQVRAWRPDVPGVAEVFHARFVDHVYPLHTHDTWTVLIVDTGAVRYDLDHDEHGVLGSTVALLPPHVPHNGRSATGGEFRKRVLYLEPDQIDTDLIGRAVDRPEVIDASLFARLSGIHRALAEPGEEFEAESLLSLVRERVEQHLRRMPPADPVRDAEMARRLRELLDTRISDGICLTEASRLLQAHPTHLVRSFGREFGLPPHRYLTGRRIDRARRLLLAGQPAAEVATAVGFHDQPHLTRHFKRVLGVTPGAYARGTS